MNLKPALLLSQYLHLMQFDIHKALIQNKLKRQSREIKGRWLDIGSGDQPYRKYFVSAEYLSTNTKYHYSAEEIKRLSKTTTYWIEDGKSLPVADQSLDGVACFQVLSVMENPDAFFREINRVLKPGGRLLLSTDFLYPVWSVEDRNRYTALSLNRLSSNNGFGQVNTESFGGFGSMIYSLFMRYMRSFPEIWKKKNTAGKIFSSLYYLILLLLLPVISLKGMIIYMLEKGNRQNTDFTFNIFLSATKLVQQS